MTPPRTEASRRISPDGMVLLIALAIVAVMGIATLIWGLPGLAMTAMALVPICFAVLLLISVGK